MGYYNINIHTFLPFQYCYIYVDIQTSSTITIIIYILYDRAQLGEEGCNKKEKHGNYAKSYKIIYNNTLSATLK